MKGLIFVFAWLAYVSGVWIVLIYRDRRR